MPAAICHATPATSHPAAAPTTAAPAAYRRGCTGVTASRPGQRVIATGASSARADSTAMAGRQQPAGQRHVILEALDGGQGHQQRTDDRGLYQREGLPAPLVPAVHHSGRLARQSGRLELR